MSCCARLWFWVWQLFVFDFSRCDAKMFERAGRRQAMIALKRTVAPKICISPLIGNQYFNRLKTRLETPAPRRERQPRAPPPALQRAPFLPDPNAKKQFCIIIFFLLLFIFFFCLQKTPKIIVTFTDGARELVSTRNLFSHSLERGCSANWAQIANLFKFKIFSFF